MAMKPLPEQATLRQLLDYDPLTGFLTWKPRTGAGNFNARRAGKRAFTSRMPNGYYQARLGGIHFLVHRLVWKLVNGFDPDVIDHINGDKGDNRIANLRNVDWALNARNKPRFCSNTSGHTGVHFCRFTGRWRAEMHVDGEHVRIGRFDTIEAAVAARREAALAHGFHENHGR